MNGFEFNDDIRREAKAAVCCWLATVSEDGTPNVSPKELWKVFDNKTLVIANIASPISMANVIHSELVCVSFIDVLRQKGYKLTGRADYIDEGSEAFEPLSEPLKEIAGDLFKIKGVFRVLPHSASPIIAPSYYVRGASEEDMIEQSKQTYGVS